MGKTWVNYVDKESRDDAFFTERLQAAMDYIRSQGGYLVNIIDNRDTFTILGVWLIWEVDNLESS